MNFFNLMLGINLIAAYCLLVWLILKWIMSHEINSFWAVAWVFVLVNSAAILGGGIFPALEKYLPL